VFIIEFVVLVSSSSSYPSLKTKLPEEKTTTTLFEVDCMDFRFFLNRLTKESNE